jgi:hypothetical protein
VTTDLDERSRQLGARVAAARAELDDRRDFEDDEIGDILEWINDAVQAVTHEDATAANARYDEIEARLAEAEARLAAARP